MNRPKANKAKKPLTGYVPAGGCACKLRSHLLREALHPLATTVSENVLVDMTGSDDAGVYQLTPDVALVQTLDFFHPMVDDPTIFGEIAAANSLSDCYAMGGTPLTAMNIVGFPVALAEDGTLAAVLAGASRVLQTAGVSLVGGHTIILDAPVYGLSITGRVSPQQIWHNTGAQPGDVLLLTKPLGTGALMTARKGGLFIAESETAIASMRTTNQQTAAVLQACTVHACTDVTGFGLLGHALEMVGDDAISITIQVNKVPIFPGAYDAVRMGLVPAATYANQAALTEVAGLSPGAMADILCDPQTSGGLLIAIPAAEEMECIEALVAAGVQATTIGYVETRKGAKIYVEGYSDCGCAGGALSGTSDCYKTRAGGESGSDY